MEAEAEGNSGRGARKKTRREILETKKAAESRIRAASLVKDHLANFPHFRHYRGSVLSRSSLPGLHAHLESGDGSRLPVHTKQYIQNLLKSNMEAPFGPEWPVEEKIKKRDMVAQEARYIFVHEVSNEYAAGASEFRDVDKTCSCKGPIVGFVHFRFVLEEEVPVLYVYELQLEHRAQGKGLGKFLMQLIELIASQNGMGAVVLTVQRANPSAMNFYICKLRYNIAAISPSKVNRLGPERNYEILCKAFEPEAQAVLELCTACTSLGLYIVSVLETSSLTYVDNLKSGSDYEVC